MIEDCLINMILAWVTGIVTVGLMWYAYENNKREDEE